MFNKISYNNQPKSIPLTKPQSSYKKLEKEMNKPPSDYDAINKPPSDYDAIKNW